MRLITFAGARSLGTSIFRLGCFFLRIVMAISGDAIATGIVTSLARPEANLTGSTFFLPELNAKDSKCSRKPVRRLLAWRPFRTQTIP